MKKYFLILLFLILPLVSFSQPKETPKDVFLVLDISLSMEGKGQGAHDIFAAVKNELIETVKKLNLGDAVTIIRYGAHVLQGDRIPIKTEEEREKIIEEIKSYKANSKWTYTSLMFKRLYEVLELASKESPNLLRVAFIFSDAIDDPPHEKERLNLQEKTEKCENTSKDKNQFVYMYSLEGELSQNLANQLRDCFPNSQNIVVKENPAEQMERLRNEALQNLIPRVAFLISPSSSPKPGTLYQGKVTLEANQLAEGYELEVMEKLPEDGLSEFKADQKTLTLAEGENELNYSFEVDVRAEDQVALSLQFTPVSAGQDNEIYFLPDGKNEIDVEIQLTNLTLAEKFTSLPEYYISLILAIIILLFLLYKIYRYLTFKPVLVLRYWTTPEGGDIFESDLKKLKAKAKRNSKKKGQEEDNSEEEIQLTDPVKEEIDFIQIEPSEFFIGSDEDVTEVFKPNLVLSELQKGELIHLKKVGEARKSRLKSLGNWKRKIGRKLKFGGSMLKNGCYFTYGPYSFEVETNLPPKKY